MHLMRFSSQIAKSACIVDILASCKLLTLLTARGTAIATVLMVL